MAVPYVGEPARSEVGTVACLLVLTFSTGIIDALSWLGLNGVFTANMTGNVLIIGMGAVGAGGAHWAPPLAALVLFLVGAATVGLVQLRAAPGWGRATTAIFLSVGAAVLVVGIVTLALPPERFEVSAYVVTAVLAFGMGMQGAEALRLAVPQLITVAVSSAVVGLGAALFVVPKVGSETRGGIVRRVGAIAALAGGAIVGSLLLRVSFGLGLVAASVVILTACCLTAWKRLSASSDRGAR